jgi:hypothetical protein
MRSLIAFYFLTGLLFTHSFVYGQSKYLVTDMTDGGGSGTLRWAIGRVNTTGSLTVADTILFDDNLSLPATLDLAAELPPINRRVVIDASRLNSYSGTPLITLNGHLQVGYGLNFADSAAYSILRGIRFINFGAINSNVVYGAAIYLQSVSHLTIERCHVYFNDSTFIDTYNAAAIAIPIVDGITIKDNFFSCTVPSNTTQRPVGISVYQNFTKGLYLLRDTITGFLISAYLQKLDSLNKIESCVFSDYAYGAISVDGGNLDSAKYELSKNLFLDTLGTTPFSFYNLPSALGNLSIQSYSTSGGVSTLVGDQSITGATIEVYASKHDGQALRFIDSLIADNTGH